MGQGEIKAGDKVRCIEAWSDPSFAHKIGDVFTVRDLHGGGGLYLEGQGNGHFLAERFEKVEDAPTQEDTTKHTLKVGDRVSFFDRWDDVRGVATVTRVAEDGVYIDSVDEFGSERFLRLSSTHWGTLDERTLIAGPTKPAFKVGDRVRVSKENRYCARQTEYTVFRIHDGSSQWGQPGDLECGMAADGDNNQMVHPDDVELIVDHEDAPELYEPKPADWRMQYDNSSARRKDQPVHAGVMEYMPAALRLCAEVSRLGNEKHRPGQPLGHSRGKSSDNLDAAARHLLAAFEPEKETNLLEMVHAFWRLGIQIQVTCEERYGWPKAPRAEFDE